MVYDPNGGSGEWKFFQGLGSELSGSGDQGNDPGRNTWGGPGYGPGNRGGSQESGSPSGFGLGQARTPRISAAGFDIDTGKFYGPKEPIGYDPDTGRAIWPGQG